MVKIIYSQLFTMIY